MRETEMKCIEWEQIGLKHERDQCVDVNISFGVISDLSVTDVGNYSCRIGGPQNTFVASVTHQLSVRGIDTVLHDLYVVYYSFSCCWQSS